MNILILPDQLDGWSCHNRSKAIQKFIPEHRFEIIGGLNNPGCLDNHSWYDLIHFNFSYNLDSHYDFIMKNRDRVIITVVNERSLLAGHGVDQARFEQLLRNSPFVTSVSKKIADMVGARYIPNGIDEDLFPAPRTVVVGYSGTNRENKNYAIVEEACRQLGVEFRTTLYHRDSPKNYVSHDLMAEFYRGLNVYVHASATEGFNNTIIEALSCNVPVLMTRQGCWHEFEGYVEFIEPTVSSIKDGLSKFTGRRLIESRFLWKNIIPQYKAIYEEAYARRSDG